MKKPISPESYPSSDGGQPTEQIVFKSPGNQAIFSGLEIQSVELSPDILSDQHQYSPQPITPASEDGSPWTFTAYYNPTGFMPLSQEGHSCSITVTDWLDNGAYTAVFTGTVDCFPDQKIAISFSRNARMASKRVKFGETELAYMAVFPKQQIIGYLNSISHQRMKIKFNDQIVVSIACYHNMRDGYQYYRHLLTRKEKQAHFFYYLIFRSISAAAALVNFQEQNTLEFDGGSVQHCDLHPCNFLIDEVDDHVPGFRAELIDFDRASDNGEIDKAYIPERYLPAQAIKYDAANIDVYGFAYCILCWLSPNVKSLASLNAAFKSLDDEWNSIFHRGFARIDKAAKSMKAKQKEREFKNTKSYTGAFKNIAKRHLRRFRPVDLSGRTWTSLYKRFERLILKMLEHDPKKRIDSRNVLKELVGIAREFSTLNQAPHWLTMPLFRNRDISQIETEFIREEVVSRGKREQEESAAALPESAEHVKSPATLDSDYLPGSYLRPLCVEAVFDWYKSRAEDSAGQSPDLASVNYIADFWGFLKRQIHDGSTGPSDTWACWLALGGLSAQSRSDVRDYVINTCSNDMRKFPSDVISRLRIPEYAYLIEGLNLSSEQKLIWLMNLIDLYPKEWEGFPSVNLKQLFQSLKDDGLFEKLKGGGVSSPVAKKFMRLLQDHDVRTKVIMLLLNYGLAIKGDNSDVQDGAVPEIMKDFISHLEQTPKAFFHLLILFPEYSKKARLYHELNFLKKYGIFSDDIDQALSDYDVPSFKVEVGRHKLAEHLISERRKAHNGDAPKLNPKVNYAMMDWRLYELAGKFDGVMAEDDDPFWNTIKKLYENAYNQGVDLSATSFLDHAIAFKKHCLVFSQVHLADFLQKLHITAEGENDPWKYYLLDAQLALAVKDELGRDIAPSVHGVGEDKSMMEEGELGQDSVVSASKDELDGAGEEQAGEASTMSESSDLGLLPGQGEDKPPDFFSRHIIDLSNALEQDKPHRYFNTNKATSLCKTVSEIAHKYTSSDEEITAGDIINLNAKKEACASYVHTRKAVAAIITPLLFALLGAVLGATIGFILGMVSGPGALGAAAFGATIGAKKFWMIGGVAAMTLTSGLPVTLWRRRHNCGDLTLSASVDNFRKFVQPALPVGQ